MSNVIKLPERHNATTRRFARSESEAFADVRARCGDEEVCGVIFRGSMEPTGFRPIRRPGVIPTKPGWLSKLLGWFR